MEFMELVRQRRSIRHYAERPIEIEKIEAVLEAGRLAPSARNDQAWHFYAVQEPSRLRELAKAADQDSAYEAPCILAVTAPAGRVMACGQPAGTVDCSIALSYMQLAAVEQGLGTVWLGSFDADAAAKVLELEPGMMVVALSPLGYPAEQPEAKPRNPLTDVATII